MENGCDLILRNAKLDKTIVDIAIKGKEIVNIDKEIEGEFREELDVMGKLTLPSFIDSHMHLDNAFVGGEKKWVTNTLAEAIDAKNYEKRTYTLDDVKNRARKVAEMALKKGTTAIRTHVDLDEIIGLTSLEALIELKKELSNWMDIQVVAFVLEPLTTSNAGIPLLKKAMIMGADVVGGVPDSDPNPEKYIALIFETAKEFNADIDLHIDESNDPSISLLEYYAEKTLENEYEGRVTASHCSSLSAVSDHTAMRIIKKVKKARINVIANPLTNLYLWGNDGKPEGVTRVKELLEAGVNVAYATDNTMDPFNPLGNANMLLSGLFLAYIEHIGSKLSTILKMGTYNAAKVTKIIPNYGIKKGGRADIMVLDAEDPEEAIIKQAETLYVIKNGRTKVDKGVLTSGAKLKIL